MKRCNQQRPTKRWQNVGLLVDKDFKADLEKYLNRQL